MSRISERVLQGRRAFLQAVSAGSLAWATRNAFGQANLTADQIAAQGLCIDPSWGLRAPVVVDDDAAAAAPGGRAFSVMDAVREALLKGRNFQEVLAGVSDSPQFTAPPDDLASAAPNLAGDDDAPLGAQAAAVSKWEDPKLRLHFFQERPTWRVDAVLKAIQQWSDACALTFTKVNSPRDADIRLDFAPNVNVSLLGTSSRVNNLNPGYGTNPRASMNLALQGNTRDIWLILHEFGHAIGLIHEHQRPDRNNVWKFSEAVYAHFKKITGWERPSVDAQILKVFNQHDLIKASKVDPESVMCYAIDERCLAAGPAVKERPVLSELDKAFVADKDFYGPNPNGGGGGKPGTDPKDNGSGKGGTGGGVVTLNGEGTRGYCRANQVVDFKLTVPSGGQAVAIYTEGSTQVVLQLLDASGKDVTPANVAGEMRRHGTYDLCNDVIRSFLGAGDYTVRVMHVSRRGGGEFHLFASTKATFARLLEPNAVRK